MTDHDPPPVTGMTPAESHAGHHSLPTAPNDRRSRWRNRCYGAAAVLLALLMCIRVVTGTIAARKAAISSNCKGHLKQIVVALHNYHDTHGCFPPAYLADASGKPMHSWRTLILPFLDSIPLYNSYRFDEPGDGPHNSQLHQDPIKSFYHCQSDAADPTRQCETSYVAIVGDETAWPGATAVTLRDFADGTANTILVIEVTNSGIHWMEPRDLTLAEALLGINAQPASGLAPGSQHTRGVNAVFVDGTVKFLPDDLSLQQLRSRLTRGAGDDPDGG